MALNNIKKEEYYAYLENLNEQALCDALISFKDTLSFDDTKPFFIYLSEKELIRYLEHQIKDLSENELVYLFSYLSNENMIAYFKKYQDKIKTSKNINLILSNISDPKLKVQFLIQFYSKLEEKDWIRNVSLLFGFANISYEEIEKLLDVSFLNLDKKKHIRLIKKIDDQYKTLALTKYHDILSEEEKIDIMLSFKDDGKIEMLKLYKKSLSHLHIFKVLCEVEDPSLIISFLKQNMDLCLSPDPYYVTNLIDKKDEIKDFFVKQLDLSFFEKNYYGKDEEILNTILFHHIHQDFWDHLKEEEKQAYFDLLNSNVHDTQTAKSNREIVLRMLDENMIQKIKKVTGYDILYLVKYLLNNPNIWDIIHVIDVYPEEYQTIHQLLKNQIKDNPIYDFHSLIFIAHFIQKYPSLCHDICHQELNQQEIHQIIRLMHMNSTLDITHVKELSLVDHKIDQEIEKVKETNSSLELKNTFLKYFCNLSYPELMDILDNLINTETLQKIMKKKMKDKQKLEVLDLLITFLEETIHSTHDISSLKKMLSLIDTKEKREKYAELYQYFMDIKELIREAYEIDANATLTDLSNLPDILYHKEGYYDLSKCSYGLYAHALEDHTNIDALVHPFYKGFQFICLTPISDEMNKGFYTDGVVLLYDHVHEGSFIGSSITNVGSNRYAQKNNFEMNHLPYHQFEFKDSSKKKVPGRVLHSETNVFRENLIPSGVLVRGEEPSFEEQKVKNRLEEILQKKIPFIKVQKVGEKINNPITIENNTKEVNEILSFTKLKQTLEELKKIEINKDQITKIRNVKYQMGATHNLYLACIDDEYYYLKPAMDKKLNHEEQHRLLSTKIGYEIQKRVNPEAAIKVRNGLARIGEEDISCSFIKMIPNSHDFEHLDISYYPNNHYRELKSSEVETLLKEFVVDYLIFNQDVKGANFISDGNKIYGVDKEQALKFALDMPETDLDFNVNKSNAPQSMYKSVFAAYKDGKQEIKEEVWKSFQNSANNIEQMDDETYYHIFEEYVKKIAQNTEEEKRYHYYILNRKHHVKEAIQDFIKSVKTNEMKR